MAYSDQLEAEGINSQYIVILNPRRQIPSGGWIVDGATSDLYQVFDLGPVTSLEFDGTVSTPASSRNDVGIGGDWYYDSDAQRLWLDGTLLPNSFDFNIVTYQLYLSTEDSYFYSNPLDDTSEVVYYEPLVVKSPVIRQDVSDTLFGFLPYSSNTIIFSTITGFFQEHVYASSFNDTKIDVYHYLGSLTVANTKKLFSSRCGDISYDQNNMSLSLYSGNRVYETFYRHISGSSFFATSDFPNLDPTYVAKPIRACYGIVEGFVPVNVDYNDTAPTTSNNREWVCVNPKESVEIRNYIVPASPVSTTTRTYADASIDRLSVGDEIYINGSITEYVTVTAVGSDYVEHAAISVAATSGDGFQGCFVGNMTIVQDGITYKPRYFRDYKVRQDTTPNTAGFTLQAGMEAALGMPRALSPTDTLFVRLYGPGTRPTLGGSPFTSSETTGNLANPIVIIYRFIKDFLGFSESEINLTSFTDARDAITSNIGFAIPRTSIESFPSYKKLIANILQTELLQLSFDDDNKVKIEVTGPLSGTDDKTIDKNEYLDGSLKFLYSYNDIVSDVIVEYDGSEANNKNEVSSGLNFRNVRSVSNNAKYLHKIEKQQTFQSLHIYESESQDLADRIGYALGDRQGKITFKTKNRFFDIEINDVVKVQSDKITGFEYVRDTTREIRGKVQQSNKSLNDIEVEISDQKGIEDNSGSW